MKNEKRMMSVRVSKKLIKKLKSKIENEDITLSEILRTLLKEYLYHNKKIDLLFDKRIERIKVSFRFSEEDARMLHVKSFDKKVRKTTILEGLLKEYLQN